MPPPHRILVIGGDGLHGPRHGAVRTLVLLGRDDVGGVLHRRADIVALLEEVPPVVRLVDADRDAEPLVRHFEEDVVFREELVERDDVGMPQRSQFVV